MADVDDHDFDDAEYLDAAHSNHFGKRGDWESWTTPEAKRQGIATLKFVIDYQWIITAIVILLTLRNIYLYLARRHRRFQLALEKQGHLTPEKLMDAETRQAMVSWGSIIDSYVYMPMTSRWWCTLENPLQVFIFVLAFAVNVSFILTTATDFQGPEDVVWNKIHVIALRCGFMSGAQLPAIFALTGRNSVIQTLTGIEYTHLRFVHKLLACWCGLLGVIHTLDATMAHFVWYGNDGVKHLFTHYLGITGIIMLGGFFLLSVFAIRSIRMRYYELFLAAHITGAILMLVGLRYHVPALRIWVYAPMAFWVIERVLRLLQVFSRHLLVRFKFRPPFVQAHATLIEGAIVLRVPFKGTWKAGQHAYVSFWDSAFIRTPIIYGQNHPFSIANVPGSSEVDPTGKIYEMIFVMRTRDGMTSIVEQRLAKSSNGALPFLVAIEGPYGHSIDTEQFQEVLFVAGGSGITHIMSMTADVIHRARTGFSRVKKLKLVWTVQNIEQSIWSLTELLLSVKKAHDAGVELVIELYVTRGMLSKTISRTESFSSMEKEKGTTSRVEVRPANVSDRRASVGGDLGALVNDNPMASALAVIPGRPPISGLVPAFVAGAHGRSLVVACGPAQMSNSVRVEVNKLVSTYPVQMDIALFEC